MIDHYSDVWEAIGQIEARPEKMPMVAWVKPLHDLFPKQREFILSDRRYTLYHGGVRSGKSVGIVYKALRLARPNTVGMIASFTWTSLKKVIIPLINEVLQGYPREWHQVNKSDGFYTIKHPAGDAIIWLSHLDDPGTIQGTTLDWYIVDEGTVGISEETYRMLNLRISKPGAQGNVCANPSSKSHFLYPFFFDVTEKQASRRCLIHTTAYDNPKLPPEYLEEYETMPEHWRRRYIEGEWGNMEGAVYPTFDRKLHVQEFDNDKGWEWWVFVDQGYEGFYCALFAGSENREKLYIFDEIYLSKVLPERRAVQIIEKCEAWGMTDVETVMDIAPKSDFMDMQDRLLDARIFSNGAWKGAGSVEVGINRVRQRLEPYETGHPKLLIHPRCQNTVREMESYSLQKSKNGIWHEVPVKENDHACDALRYGVVHIYGANIKK